MSSILLRLLFVVAWLNNVIANHATIQEIPHKLVRFPMSGPQNTTVKDAVSIGKPEISVVELDGVNLKQAEETTEQILLQTLIKLDAELRSDQNSSSSNYCAVFALFLSILLSFIRE